MDQRIQAFLADMRRIIAVHGHAIQAVGAEPPDRPGWAYTIGLLPICGYEVIVCCLPPEVAHTILNDIAASIKAGEVIPLDTRIYPNTWIRSYPALFRLCDPLVLGDRVNVAKAIHGTDDVPVRQLVLCDRKGLFPEDPGYDLERQPLLY